jgi:hypothetical protein
MFTGVPVGILKKNYALRRYNVGLKFCDSIQQRQ